MPPSIFSLDLTSLTEGQKVAIAKLRKLVNGELTAEYMSEDYYLAKWLYQTDFRVEQSARLLREHLEWRRQQKIDKTVGESWDDMHTKFPYRRDTKDKSGKPCVCKLLTVLYFDLSQWDIASFLAEDPSNSNRLARYIVKLHEESESHVRQLRTEGQSITQFNLLINLDGYCIPKHASFRCFYFYRRMGQILTPNFPRCVERVIFVNVPPIFRLAYLFLSTENQKCINIFGRDIHAWGPVLLEYIDQHQIPEGIFESTYN